MDRYVDVNFDGIDTGVWCGIRTSTTMENIHLTLIVAVYVRCLCVDALENTRIKHLYSANIALHKPRIYWRYYLIIGLCFLLSRTCACACVLCAIN